MRFTILLLALVSAISLAATNAATAPRPVASQKPQTAASHKPQATTLGTESITIPQMLSYQGKLTDTLGVPVSDTTYQVTFRLYTVATGGVSFWNETQTVRTRNGLFSTLVGSVAPIESVPAAGSLYLGMAVAGGSELSPRLQLVGSAYSYLAGKSANSDLLQGKDTTGFVRTGQASSVTSAMIVANTIVRSNVATNFKAPYTDTADYAKAAPASDSARVAGNSHLLQGKDTTALWNAKTLEGQDTTALWNAKTLQGKDTTALWNAKKLQGKDTTGFVRTGQASSVTSAMIVANTIVRSNVATNFKAPYTDTADYAKAAPAADSARVAGNSHLLQGKDTTALWNAKTFEGKDTTGFVRTGQANSITGTMIVDGTISSADLGDTTVGTAKLKPASVTAPKLNQMGASSGQVLKWTGSAWAPRNDSVGGGTVASVRQATGIVCSPNPITDSGTVRLDTTYSDGRYIKNQNSSGQTANFYITGIGQAGLLYGKSTSASYGAIVGDGGTYACGVFGTSTGVYGVFGGSTDSAGVYGTSTSGDGVYGTSSSSFGVYGKSSTSSGVTGVSASGYGAYDSSKSSCGVYGASASGNGVYGTTNGGVLSAGVYGYVHGHSGYYGQGVEGDAVGTGNQNVGVFGNADSSTNLNCGVSGEAEGSGGWNQGVDGDAFGTGDNFGVYGTASGWGSNTNYGLYGYASGSGHNCGVYGSADSGSTNYAGYFYGDVYVSGNLSKGGGSFQIDHPLDPLNKYLYHSFVESPDMKNVYDGEAVLDASGRAVVELPDYFSALNRDTRIQLTGVGNSDVYVAEKVTGNRFAIGGKPGTDVYWQVTGIRQDPYANKHRIQVEVDKSANERGKYLHPDAYGLPAEAGIGYMAPPARPAHPMGMKHNNLPGAPAGTASPLSGSSTTTAPIPKPSSAQAAGADK